MQCSSGAVLSNGSEPDVLAEAYFKRLASGEDLKGEDSFTKGLARVAIDIEELEPNWVPKLKADIRSIIKSELAIALNESLRSLITPRSPRDMSAQQAPDSAHVTGAPSSSSSDIKAQHEEWKNKQESFLTKKLRRSASAVTLELEHLPFPINHLSRVRISCRRFFVARPLPDMALARFVNGSTFKSFFLFLIFCNAVWMGWEAHLNLNDIHDNHSTSKVTNFFTIAFIIELVLKICGLQWQFFGGAEWKWNLFDALMVLLAVVNIAFGIAGNMTFARILKLARVIRVLRLFRVVQSFLELRHMIVAVHGSLSTLFWCGILFVFAQFCFAVMTMQVARTYIEKATTIEELKVVATLQRRYGTIQQSMLTLFHTISGGDWLVSAAPLEKALSGYSYVFALYIFFMSFGLLNVVIGLFCEKAAGAVASDRDLRTMREREDTESFIESMYVIFQEMDTDKTGEIDWEQFSRYIEAEGTGYFLRSHGIATQDAWALFVLLDEMDGKSSGTMDIVSFVLGMQRLTGAGCGTDIVLSIVENRKTKLAMEASFRDVKAQLTAVCEHLQNSSFKISMG